jgi:hypothetical protein
MAQRIEVRSSLKRRASPTMHFLLCPGESEDLIRVLGAKKRAGATEQRHKSRSGADMYGHS